MDLNKFLAARDSLDLTVSRIDQELAGAEDISQALYALAMFSRDLEALPGAFADLLAEKAKIDGRRACRETDAKKAKHAVLMLETKLAKLKESLAYNVSNLAAAVEADPSEIAKTLGTKLPGTRRERIEQLTREIAETEAALVGPKAVHKKAVTLFKSDVTRTKNLALEIAEVGRKLSLNNDRLTEMAKLARKTAEHLKNRQGHRDRKAGRARPAAAQAAAA